MGSTINRKNPAIQKMLGWMILVLYAGVILGWVMAYGIQELKSGSSIAGYIVIGIGYIGFLYMTLRGVEKVVLGRVARLYVDESNQPVIIKNDFLTTGDFVAPNLSSGSYSEIRSGSGDQ